MRPSENIHFLEEENVTENLERSSEHLGYQDPHHLIQCFFFRQPAHFGDHFLPAILHILATAFQYKHLKIFRALRAPCFERCLARKTPFWGLRSDGTEIKKLFLLFFLLLFHCRHAQRGEIFVFPSDFSSGTVSERR